MDIPAPKAAEDTNSDEVRVRVEPSQETVPARSEIAAKGDSAGQEEAESDSIATLISSKKYNLNIKEKRTKPLLVLSLGIKRKKKPKTQHKSIKKVKPQKDSKKQMTQLGLLAILVVGLLLAIDIGWLNLGFELPFSLFGN